MIRDSQKQLLNYRLILHFLGLTLLFEALFMLLDLAVCWFYDPGSLLPVLESAGLVALAGGGIYLWTGSKKELEPGIRDSFLLVVLCWLLLGLSGTLPFLFSGAIPQFVDAWFESVSGFTTTGSSILKDIESVPRGILFWRSETHWIGGMGIIVLMLAVFPHFKVNGMQLFGAESSAIVFERLKPRLIDNMKRLWVIYLLLTGAEAALLWFGGMDVPDSLCHAFGTVATGGFSTKNASIAAFSPYIQYVIIVFMLLAGINFVLHYYILRGRFRQFSGNQELRLYLSLVVVVSLIISAILIVKGGYIPEKAIRESLFQVVSIITCTGFSTADYQVYATPAIVMLLLLMLIGGCAGSTSGGIKVVRILILFKKLGIQFQKLLHPNMVREIRYNQLVIDKRLQGSILTYILLYIMLVAAGTFIMLVLGNDIHTSLGSVATCLGGVGPGLGLVGPAGNFSSLSGVAKVLLTLFMILGRLEILTVFVLFTPSFRKV